MSHKTGIEFNEVWERVAKALFKLGDERAWGLWLAERLNGFMPGVRPAHTRNSAAPR